MNCINLHSPFIPANQSSEHPSVKFLKFYKENRPPLVPSSGEFGCTALGIAFIPTPGRFISEISVYTIIPVTLGIQPFR